MFRFILSGTMIFENGRITDMREINVTTTDHTQQISFFCIIAIVYVIAGAIGLIIYQSLPYVFWLRLLISDVLATVVVFVFSCIFRNASVYDPYWSVQPQQNPVHQL